MCISFYAASYRHLLRLRQPLGQTSLFAVRSVLMNNALCGSLIDRTLRRAEKRGVGLLRGNGGIKLLDLGLHRRLDHAVAQVLLASHLHALHGRFDIRQNLHLPTQFNINYFITIPSKFQPLRAILLKKLG